MLVYVNSAIEQNYYWYGLWNMSWNLKSYIGIIFWIYKYGIHKIVYFPFDEGFIDFLVSVINQPSWLLYEDI